MTGYFSRKLKRINKRKEKNAQNSKVTSFSSDPNEIEKGSQQVLLFFLKTKLNWSIYSLYVMRV